MRELYTCAYRNSTTRQATMNRKKDYNQVMEETEDTEKDVLYTIIPEIDDGIAEDSGLYEDEDDEYLDIDF